MLLNMKGLLNRFGYIPNGNRNYFLGRSQPPFFPLMVKSFASNPLLFIDDIRQEYDFWNRPEHIFEINSTSNLTRYYDYIAEPREESFR